MREPRMYQRETPGAKQFVWTEQLAQKALVFCLDAFKNEVFPNVMLGGGEMDLAVLSPALYLTEIEIKISPRDWRDDRHKDKWLPKNAGVREQVKYFCYAVPVELMKHMPEDLDPRWGIIGLFWDYDQGAGVHKVWGQWAKQPKVLGKVRPIDPDDRQRLLASIYHRYWRQLHAMSVLDDRLLPLPEPEVPPAV